ncbi:MAG TPA: hypothetical protein EYN91_21815 [Candidatus Melainabacteria bacterium]|jgi:hypothetical protein|nr:hypothetical protein [Candidatus Melainabacteria bacterium]
MSSKRYSSLLMTALFVSSTAAANAGSKSMLDPYAAVQPPASKKPVAARSPHQDVTDATHTTYISMPMPADQAKPAGGGKLGGLFGGKKDKTAKAPKAPQPEKVAEAPADKGDGIAAKSLDSMKNAGSTIVGGTKAAGSKIAEGSKVVGGGIATGAKKVGGGIATGAKASGDYIMKGVHAIGSGFKATGEKVKGGAGSAGSKVAGLPKLWGKKGGGSQEKAKQEAIAKAVAERKAAQQQGAQQPPQLAKDAEWESPDAVANAESPKPMAAPAAAPVQTNTVGFQALQQQATKAQKGGGITGGFSKAFGKLNPFGGKSTPAVHPVVRPQSAIQSTAATQDAIPQ